MNKAILALFFIFNLYTALAQVSPTVGAPATAGTYGDKFAKDYIDKYAGNFINSTTAKPTTTTPNTPNTPSDFGSKSFYSNFTCPQAVNRTNLAIAELAAASTNATDLWSVYGTAQKLNGMSEFLNYGCDLTGFKLLNIGQTGLNKTQDEACDKLIAIIQPLVDPTPTGVSASSYQATLNLSQQAFGLANSLGNQCNVTLVDPAHPLVPQNTTTPLLVPTILNPENQTLPGFETVEPVALESAVPFSSFVQAKLTFLRRLL